MRGEHESPTALGSVRVPLWTEDQARMQRQGEEALRLNLPPCGLAGWHCLIVRTCACVCAHMCTQRNSLQMAEHRWWNQIVPWGVRIHSYIPSPECLPQKDGVNLLWDVVLRIDGNGHVSPLKAEHRKVSESEPSLWSSSPKPFFALSLFPWCQVASVSGHIHKMRRYVMLWKQMWSLTGSPQPEN